MFVSSCAFVALLEAPTVAHKPCDIPRIRKVSPLYGILRVLKDARLCEIPENIWGICVAVWVCVNGHHQAPCGTDKALR